ncbi:hypothetical protein OE88DRAFT_1812151 [Heliocybe sulcata]|uniref:Protein kinase domain-containing protein n=1 Tax=Heliocybe sulcata TaxID=5364 RepID=A0A5C3MXF4_9AGAM|nr:hypothetical protein OE88DRAFT_1812151 [Heliocybe sulcata]
MSALHAQCTIAKIRHGVLVAHNKSDVLHRDMSPQKSLFEARESGDVYGTLTDGDLPKGIDTVESERARLQCWTGTWQFLSYWLLMNSSKDDLQSFFWTLLYTALHVIPCSLSTEDVVNMLKEIFDEARWDDVKICTVGGSQKYMMISKGNYILPDTIAGKAPIIFGPQAAPLNHLLKSLFFLFQDWDICNTPGISERYHLALKPEAEKPLTSEAIIQLFQDAYTNPEWSHESGDRQEGLVPKEGRGSSSKHAIAEGSEQRRKTQHRSQTSNTTQLEMLDE